MSESSAAPDSSPDPVPGPRPSKFLHTRQHARPGCTDPLALVVPLGSSGQKTTLLTQFLFKKLFDPTVLFLECHYGNGSHEK